MKTYGLFLITLLVFACAAYVGPSISFDLDWAQNLGIVSYTTVNHISVLSHFLTIFLFQVAVPFVAAGAFYCWHKPGQRQRKSNYRIMQSMLKRK